MARDSSALRLSLLNFCLAGVLVAITAAARSSTAPLPLSLQPTEFWDGNDGKWSSFAIQIGTPPQSIRVFPSTGTNAFWAVIPQGCPSYSPSSCSNSRGSLFHPGYSKTWNKIGDYTLGTFAESPLGLSGNAAFGYDNVTLGYKGQGIPDIQHQVIQGFATPDFYLGAFGLDPSAINLSSVENIHPSPLLSLFSAAAIPSISWAYTAGAHYQSPPLFGSLVLGGYDTQRFSLSNSLPIPFASDESRRFVVGIQSISSDKSMSNDQTNVNLLPSGISSYIDSLVSEIWLPVDACKAFEQAFQISWNSDLQLYNISDEQATELQRLNPTVTFTIGAGLQDSNVVEITLPYASFDLQITLPSGGKPIRYFPLKRATHADQYTLGRTFLQQAYLISDYHRQTFSLSPALFPSAPNSERLVAILPPGEARSPSSNPSSSGAGLGIGAIVGITIGVVLAITLVCLVALILYRRRRRAGKGGSGAAARSHKTLFAEADGTEQRHEKGGSTTNGEDKGRNELEAQYRSELEGENAAKELSAESQQQLDLRGRFTEDFGQDIKEVWVDYRGRVYSIPADDVVSPVGGMVTMDGLVSPIGGLSSPIGGLVSPIAELASPIAELDGTPKVKS